MIMNKKIILSVFSAVVIMAVSGCSSKNAPDEFMVLKNPPLALPPDYYLTPEGPYSDLDEVIDPQELAKRALFGES